MGVEDILYQVQGLGKDEQKELFEKFLLEYKESLLPGRGLGWFKFSQPDPSILRVFRNPGITGQVCISTDEMSALCPLTGYPDFYQVAIRYFPGSWCIESKSAKFYFGSYRDFGGFIEQIALLILQHYGEVLIDARSLEVEITMKSRGGIAIVVNQKSIEPVA